MNKTKKILLIIAIAIIGFCSLYWTYIVWDRITNKNILVNNHESDITYEDNKFNIYFFWGQGCPHCEELTSYLKTIPNKYRKKYKLVTFEVWNDVENKDLMHKLGSTLNTKPEGTPFVIIGDKYFTGYNKSKNDSILEMIKEECNKDIHYDVYKTYKEEQK